MYVEKTYEGADGHAGCHGRNGARADVAREPAAGGEDGEEESLGCGIVLFSLEFDFLEISGGFS